VSGEDILASAGKENANILTQGFQLRRFIVEEHGSDRPALGYLATQSVYPNSLPGRNKNTLFTRCIARSLSVSGVVMISIEYQAPDEGRTAAASIPESQPRAASRSLVAS
jgi:hypothetical protein